MQANAHSHICRLCEEERQCNIRQCDTKGRHKICYRCHSNLEGNPDCTEHWDAKCMMCSQCNEHTGWICTECKSPTCANCAIIVGGSVFCSICAEELGQAQ